MPVARKSRHITRKVKPERLSEGSSKIDTVTIGSLKWYHVPTPSDENLNYLKEKFDFHPLDIEDCKSTAQHPKIDVYEDYNFLILHFPYFDKINKFLKTKEVKIFWGKDYIITVGKSHWIVRRLFMRSKNHTDLFDDFMVPSSDALLYLMLEQLMVETLSLIRRVGNEVDQLSEGLFSKKAERIIERISITRKNIVLLDTIFKPQLRLFHKFESGEIKGYADNMEDYWGNILDYYQKMWDMIEDYEELIQGLSKTFDSMQANRTNQIMKILMFISTLFLPLTFITGLYGMNIALPLQDHPHVFLILLGIMIFIILGLIIYFKQRRWM